MKSLGEFWNRVAKNNRGRWMYWLNILIGDEYECNTTVEDRKLNNMDCCSIASSGSNHSHL